MKYCKKCVYPMISVNLILDDEGICSACRLQEEFDMLTEEFWEQRRKKFIELTRWAKSKSTGNYDCVIPVSGGKDSYFQVHKVLEYGLKPLLVTYHGNNYLPEGQRNLDRMREKLNVDHIVFGPSIEILKKLNRGCFEIMGDMNWHAHAGIKTYPMHIAVKFNIPLVVWGEITWTISGMFSANDFVEYNKRTVFEHDMRGFTTKDMLERIKGLTHKDLVWLTMPSDKEFEETQTKGIYVGNFFKWDPNIHAQEMKKNYGFEFASQPFARTYRTMSNLDDMHENGIHDYLKYIKFGYGRATDHASKDIRSGYLTREEGLEMVRKYDHIRPQDDLNRWLKYVRMTEEQFDHIADSFRDHRVWWVKDGKWWKNNLWGDCSAYEDVKLEKDKISKYIRQ
ncbi:MAG: LPS biosynthesis protein [Bdellovibrionales bacterium RIFOXYB1_FULL_37_110]|nr:MAG: LPS biosynthesis protein [Bdellovibrionales bacterium RIFOXYC1_FULL_37_79]OFZ58787.1 MAG: LPS biosynthesis protein [Bdellovibrionales bacterium RIFOXYB1_FULL_37_110]OFZ64786.1 MAG: LPS biosynthesis protein [Bdellovibrionales bacterium RIFOXYD1_FULL_36_51]